MLLGVNRAIGIVSYGVPSPWLQYLRGTLGHVIAQAVSHWLPTAAARAQVRSSGICCGKSGRLSPSNSVSLADHHSTKFSILIITRERYNRPISGRSAE
jgi:hypothetical protein